jgi:phosphoglycolate phosphatase-like HAD superfamily hydrolase
MLEDLVRALDLDPSRSWMVGDSPSDVAAGRAAGLRTALLGAGGDGVDADIVEPTLAAVASRILRAPEQPARDC